MRVIIIEDEMLLLCITFDNRSLFSSLSWCSILRVSQRGHTRFPSSIVVRSEEIGSVLFMPRASSAGKAISPSDLPAAEYRPLKSQSLSRTRARHETVLHFPASLWRSTATDLTCRVTNPKDTSV